MSAVSMEAAVSFNLAYILYYHLNDKARAVELLQQSISLLRRYSLPQDGAGQTLAQHEAFLAQLSGKRKPLLRRLFGK